MHHGLLQLKGKSDGDEPEVSEFYEKLIKIPKVVGQGADAAAISADRKNKQGIFKNCAPSTDCITQINNT